MTQSTTIISDMREILLDREKPLLSLMAEYKGNTAYKISVLAFRDSVLDFLLSQIEPEKITGGQQFATVVNSIDDALSSIMINAIQQEVRTK